ncbi:MAG: fumarylacetoacetase [Paracoccaceae bacterium]|nr:MAG: fumarylacetoacetase [Paracoccaceae bacterium]
MPLMRSWVESANRPETHFPLNNLPWGVFAAHGAEPRCGVAIGDFVLDLAGLESVGLVEAGGTLARPELNGLMAQGPAVWRALRARLQEILAEDGADDALRARIAPWLVPMAEAVPCMPFRVQGFTDFYAGKHHAMNVGTMFRGPENALPPNWLHMPIGYNGRASTVVVSGTPIHRPLGQMRPPGAEMPVFGPSRRLDIELELGTVVGTGNPMGRPVTVAEAEGMIFGHVLLNDWSARDIQAWEYQPLGPFQGKAFATSISPWVVSPEALEPFRCAGPERERPLLPYLHEPRPMMYDIRLEVHLRPADEADATVICRTNYREMYYSAPQQLAHHAVCGCAMRPGDLIGSGTISGPTRDSRGSLLELTWNGQEPLTLAGGQTRSFLEDGDSVTLTGWAQGDGYRIGFGICEGTILPAVTEPDWEASR